MDLTFRGLSEDAPGSAWARVVDHGWPGWKDWFLSRGGGPTLEEAERALDRHMPEMTSLWRRLVATVNGDDELASFLSFWNPPPYLVSCSQLVVHDDEGPLLIRNYDLDPELNEATMLHTAWRKRRVMGMVEGLSGLADGMNQAGLAASLTFGGRRQIGKGFGVPFIIRYMLEICNDVEDAVELLRAVPCHMSYNVTVADRSGAWKTAFLAPDRPTIITDRRSATNHQLGVEMPRHGRFSRTLERERHLMQMAAQTRLTGVDATRFFLRGPLFSTGYDKGFGTVYTAAYRPASGAATLTFSDGTAQSWHLDTFKPAELRVQFSGEGSKMADVAPQKAAAFDRAQPLKRQSWPSRRLDAFFGELANCMIHHRDWSRLADFWRSETAPNPAPGFPDAAHEGKA